MQKEIKKYVKCLRAFTLVEMILVTGTIALVVGTLVGLIGNSYKDWKLGNSRSILLQDGRAVLEQITRILRQAKCFISVTSATDQAGQITFTDVDGVTKQFRRNTLTNEIEYGQPGSLSVLAGSVTSLVFACYDVNADSLADPVQIRKIRGAGIAMTLVDQTDSLQFTLSDRIFCMEDFQNEIIINEIMYNPSEQVSDSKLEWVELYNSSDSDIDIKDWAIWTGAQGNADLLISHPQFGNGATIIPKGGYAVVTASSTDVYKELITNGDFETGNLGSWQIDASWSRTSGDTHGGTHKLQRTDSGAGWMYQTITVPSGYNSYLFIFWEKTTAPVGQTQITATIRNTADQILATGYSGQMHSDWTYHGLDISAFTGQTVRIYFSTNKTAGSGTLCLDDISASASYVNINAVRLSVPDNKIGNGLANNTDTTSVVSSSGTISDSVTYVDSWGGDGDGASLSRIDTQGSSNDQSNWKSGPLHGTPGAKN